MGLRSGEYGGRKRTRAPAAEIKSVTNSTWWIEALSRTTIERGFSPSNGCIIGRDLSINFRNVSTLNNVAVFDSPCAQYTYC